MLLFIAVQEHQSAAYKQELYSRIVDLGFEEAKEKQNIIWLNIEL